MQHLYYTNAKPKYKNKSRNTLAAKQKEQDRAEFMQWYSEQYPTDVLLKQLVKNDIVSYNNVIITQIQNAINAKLSEYKQQPQSITLHDNMFELGMFAHIAWFFKFNKYRIKNGVFTHANWQIKLKSSYHYALHVTFIN
jgi:hypothetical protein